MAIGDQHSGHAMKYVFIPGATWGTAIGDGIAGTELSSEAIVFTPDIKVRTPNRFRGQNFPDIADLSNDSKGSMPTAVVPTQCLKTELPDFLYAAIQNVSEAVDPFQKTFTFASPGPDFSNDDGYFMTLIGFAPVASQSEKIASLIAEKLEFTLSPEANDGNLFVSATMKGIVYSAVANPSGTYTKSAQTTFNFFDIVTCTLDGTTIVPEEIKINIENTIKGVGYNASLDAPASFALTDRKISVELKGMWDAGMRAGLGKFRSGAETDFILEWGATGVDGYLAFNVKGRVANGNLAEDELRSVNITLEGASDLANTELMATIEITDGVSRSWP